MVRLFEHIGSSNFGESWQAPSFTRRLIYQFFPAHLWTQLRTELHATKIRRGHGRYRRKFADRRGLLVNIGAGSRGRDGWVNMDLFPCPGVNCVYDSRKSLPFADASVNGIFTEHFVEHLDYTEEIPLFFSECHRVLQPGGVIRIIVPDGEKYLRAYVDGWEAIKSLRGIKQDGKDPYFQNSYKSPMELINTVYRQGYQHKWIYDFDNMKVILELFGFAEITQLSFEETRQPELAIDAPSRAHESLYVEAIKPDGN